MSRAITLSSLSAMNSASTEEAFLILLTINHSSITSPIRVTSDGKDTISRGNNFIAFSFDLSLPEDSEALSATARLQIDNVDRTIIASIRAMNSSPSVLMEIVSTVNLDVVEASFPDFKMRNIQYDAFAVTGELTIEDFTAEPYPSGIFTPASFPSLF